MDTSTASGAAKIVQNAQPISSSANAWATKPATAKSAEELSVLESSLIASLEVGNDEEAQGFSQTLVGLFGPDDTRVSFLRALHDEAGAGTPSELESILRHYDSCLDRDPTNLPIAKRRVVVLQRLNKVHEAINSAVAILGTFVNDCETWAVLTELYLRLGALSQSQFCIDECILLFPNSWNLHARAGEILVMRAKTANDAQSFASLAYEAILRFCRSLELCTNYTRALFGLSVTCAAIKERFTGSEWDTLVTEHHLSYNAIEQLSKNCWSRLQQKSTDSSQPDYVTIQSLLRLQKNG